MSSHGTPLLIIDCAQIRRNYRDLRAALPNVSVHYAVKALTEAAVLGTLFEEGSHFDVASAGEIALLREQRIPAERVLHTHPIKTSGEIESALAYGCDTFVFDNEGELAKFAPYRGRVNLLLRLGFRNAHAAVDLSKKFGAPLTEAIALLELARGLGLNTVGFSFHRRVSMQKLSSARQCHRGVCRVDGRGRKSRPADHAHARHRRRVPRAVLE